ncbi:glycine-rich domain-containing protein [Streptomyces goshikiensis]|uniref:hypothetical protein n=1 Tax=Streptomyces goshikiensis TaxID=1942 RepID=UPI0036929356
MEMLETPVTLRHGHDLVGHELFGRLSAFCAEEYGLEREMAECVMDQALALLWVMGTTRTGDVMAPSVAVDPGWHTFMLHSQEYADWCQREFGRLQSAGLLRRRPVLLTFR